MLQQIQGQIEGKIIQSLESKRDKERQETIRLQWQVAQLEKAISDAKRERERLTDTADTEK